MTVFLVTGGILRRELDVFCKIRQRGLIPGGGAFRVSRCEGSSRSLAIGGAAICISARIFRIVFDRLAEFLSSSVKVFFLGKLDAALHIVSATALLGRFRSVDLSGRTTKNRYDGDSEWLLVQHVYFSFWPTFCAIYRLQARKFIQRAVSKFRCAHRSGCSVR